jgi:hypothetical protein
MKFHSDYTQEYVENICEELNSLGEIYKGIDYPYSPGSFETLTVFLQNYIVQPAEIYYHLDEKGLLFTGRCPYTGTRIEKDAPSWSYMRSRKVHVSPKGLQIMRKEDDEEYERLFGEPAPKRHQPKSGCYIATVCYGDEMAPQVIALKEYRDNVLLKYPIGKMFVSTYYCISPRIARYLESKKTINGFIRNALNRLIKRINTKDTD